MSAHLNIVFDDADQLVGARAHGIGPFSVEFPLHPLDYVRWPTRVCVPPAQCVTAASVAPAVHFASTTTMLPGNGNYPGARHSYVARSQSQQNDTGAIAINPAVYFAYSEMLHSSHLPYSEPCPCVVCSAQRASVSAAQRADGDAAAAETPVSQGATRAPPTLDDEITELLADVPAPPELGLLSSAEVDAAFEAAVASPPVEEMAVAPHQPAPMPAPCQPVDDGITEVHSATPRGRGESIKRRKRGRKPGDQRHHQ